LGELAIITENILQALAAGLLIGCIYGLMCAGLGVIFGVMRVINFAQGDFMMLGMYSAYYLATSLGLLAVLGPFFGPVAAAIITGPILFIIGIFVHRYLVTRVTGAQVAGLEGEGHFAQLILTLGVALVISNGALIFFGSEPLSIRTPLSRTAWEVGPLFGDAVSIIINQARYVGAAVSVLVAFGLYVFVTKFRFGKAFVPQPTIPNRRPMSVSMSITPIALLSDWALQSPASPAVWWQAIIPSSPMSGSNL